MITDTRFDSGKAFDWGRTSSDYAKFRDIYPNEFYERLHSLGFFTKGQKVLDLGTGTGVIPRNMYHYGADIIGTDISENQIIFAKKMAAQSNMNIRFLCSSAEDADFPHNTFDVINASQCYFYFNHKLVAPNIYKMLKSDGKLAFTYMAWLPFESKIALESEKLILKYNPVWNSCNETRHDNFIPEEYLKYFDLETQINFDCNIPFTKESWNGRIKACRGIGASLLDDEILAFEKEHLKMLNNIADNNFNILHYCAISVLKVK